MRAAPDPLSPPAPGARDDLMTRARQWAARAVTGAEVGELLEVMTQDPDTLLAWMIAHLRPEALTADLRARAQGVSRVADGQTAALQALYARPDLPVELVQLVVDDSVAALATGWTTQHAELDLLAAAGRFTPAQVGALLRRWRTGRPVARNAWNLTALSEALARVPDLPAPDLLELADATDLHLVSTLRVFLGHRSADARVWARLHGRALGLGHATMFWMAWAAQVPPSHPEVGWGERLRNDLAAGLVVIRPDQAVQILGAGSPWGPERWSGSVFDGLLARVRDDATARADFYRSAPAWLAQRVSRAQWATFLAEADREGRLHLLSLLATPSRASHGCARPGRNAR